MESPERLEIRRGLDELKPYLEAYVVHTLGTERVRHLMSADPAHRNAADVQKLRSIIIRNWDDAFGSRLPGVVREYAAAERRGEVPRKRNNYGLTPEGYARALFADGEKKGWLSDAE